MRLKMLALKIAARVRLSLFLQFLRFVASRSSVLVFGSPFRRFVATRFLLSLHSGLALDSLTESNDIGSSSKRLPQKMIDTLLALNPALKNDLASMDLKTATETLAKLDLDQMLTGISTNRKDQKDMGSYKFWQTQPVPRFDDQQGKKPITQGPIKIIKPEEVPQKPDVLIEGFEWCTLDLTDDNELRELYELLNNHYVEDDNAMFRFSYSQSFLHWYGLSIA